MKLSHEMCMGGEAPTHVGIVSILNQVCKIERNVQKKKESKGDQLLAVFYLFNSREC